MARFKKNFKRRTNKSYKKNGRKRKKRGTRINNYGSSRGGIRL